jgi:hypothetical protein
MDFKRIRELVGEKYGEIQEQGFGGTMTSIYTLNLLEIVLTAVESNDITQLEKYSPTEQWEAEMAEYAEHEEDDGVTDVEGY